MIWIIIELIACIVECVILAGFLTQYFSFQSNRNRKWKYFCLCFILTLIDITGTFIFKYEPVFMVGMIGSCTCFAHFFLKGKLSENLLISIIGYLLFYFVNLPVLYILGLFSGTTSTEIAFAHDVRRIICLFVTKVLYFTFTKIILRLSKKEKFEFSKNEWLIIISSVTTTLLIGIAMNTVITYSFLSDYVMMGTVLLLSALDVIIFQFMRKLSIANHQKIEHNILAAQLDQQQIETRRIEQQYQKISIMQHDFRNQIDCICNLLRDGEYPKALSYAESLSEKNAVMVRSHIRCSSSVVNAVVNEKISIAQENAIQCTCQIIVPVPEYLEYDLSILLANLLDNAIEECRKGQENPKILMTISDVAAYYRINVKNTISQSVLRQNGDLNTQKPDREHHGWGLKSVREIASSHNGSLDIYEKNDMFIVNVLLMKEE